MTVCTSGSFYPKLKGIIRRRWELAEQGSKLQELTLAENGSHAALSHMLLIFIYQKGSQSPQEKQETGARERYVSVEAAEEDTEVLVVFVLQFFHMGTCVFLDKPFILCPYFCSRMKT